MIVNEKALFEKLRRIEALHAGATTPGERDAAANAIRHIQDRLEILEKEDPPVEYKFTLSDGWSRKLFMALARRYGLKPFRYRRQRYTTVMVRVSKRFVDRTLWPEVPRTRSSPARDARSRDRSRSLAGLPAGRRRGGGSGQARRARPAASGPLDMTKSHP
ncbi:MAG TPA: hypothetical protein VFH68_25280 [Polyangia bacterium]|nr:hypothetical protein [Polyangia bacterium]